MSQLQSNDHVVEYVDESHTYLIDGVIVPSVSQLLKKVFPKKYEGVPQSVLNNKADYGTKVHDAIECFENDKDMPDLNIHQKLSLKQYVRLKVVHKFIVTTQEQIIHFEDIYCGRYDMTLFDRDGCLCLGDIKTTSKLDKEYLSWQLSLYELAYEHTFGTDQFPFKKFYCIYLPKGDLGQFVEIERIDRKKIEDFIYEQKNESC